MLDKNLFLNNFLKLFSGKLISLIVVIGTAPALTRLFSPEVFGITAMFMSVSGFIVPIICIRYEQTINLPKDDRNAINILIFCLISILFVITLIILITYFLDNYYLKKLDYFFLLRDYIWLISLYIFLSSINMIFEFWNLRKKKFKNLSKSNIIETVSTSGFGLWFGYLGIYGDGGLIFASIFGKLFCCFILTKSFFKKSLNFAIDSFSFKEIIFLVRRYNNFFYYGNLSIILGTLSWLLPTFLMGIFFSYRFAGLYVVGFTLLSIPSQLISSTINNVLLSAFSKSSKNILSKNLVKIINMLLSFSVMPFLLLIIISPNLFTTIFGLEYKDSGHYVQILAPFAFFWFISASLNFVFVLKEEQRVQLFWNIINFISRVISVLMGAYLDNPLLSIYLIGFFGSIVYYYKIFLVFQIIKNSVNIFNKKFFECIINSVLPAVVLIIMTTNNLSSIVIIAIAALFLLINTLNSLYKYYYISKIRTFN